jgi:hypothetical protein
MRSFGKATAGSGSEIAGPSVSGFSEFGYNDISRERKMMNISDLAQGK